MKMKVLLKKDADFSPHGGYECEWAYDPRKAELLLAIQRYSSLAYIFILFHKVQGYTFSNRIPGQGAENPEQGETGFLYEVEPDEATSPMPNHYLTFQPPRGSLHIFAGSYEVLPDVPPPNKTANIV